MSEELTVSAHKLARIKREAALASSKAAALAADLAAQAEAALAVAQEQGRIAAALTAKVNPGAPPSDVPVRVLGKVAARARLSVTKGQI